MRFPTLFSPAPSGDRKAPEGDVRRLLGRTLQGGVAAALVVFHGVLLWDRIASLTLLDPAVALRWAGTLLLLLGLARMWRTGVPLFSGRQARVVWTLVALLHASMVPGAGGGAATLAEADPGLWLTLALVSLAVVLGAVAGTFRSQQPGGRPPRPRNTTRAVRAACLTLVAPRPPPVF